MDSLAMLGFGGSSPPLSTKTLNKQYKDMENKETINENSFLEQVEAFARPIGDDITKHLYDKNKHRALIVLASDAEDDKSFKAFTTGCGNERDICKLLDILASTFPLSLQKTIIDLLQSCYKQRKRKQ